MADQRAADYRRSARNVRKVNRSLQTASERLERWLDRAVQAKRIDLAKIRTSAIPLYDTMRIYMRQEELALADLLRIAAS